MKFDKGQKNLKNTEADENKNKNDSFRVGAALALVTQLGFIIGICTVGGVFLGSWFDKKLNATSIFVIIGTLLGLVIGLLACFRLVRRALK